MAKDAIQGWMHQPLVAIAGTRAKIAVLRILWREGGPLHYREIVRRSGMAYRSIDLAVADLLTTGVVTEIRGGRERRVQLSSSHRLSPAIAGLLQVDGDFFASLRVALRTMVSACVDDGLLSASIVGAVASRAERLGDSLELVFVAGDDSACAACEARMAGSQAAIAQRFGVTVRLIGYSQVDATVMWRTRTPKAQQIVRDAELLVGTPLATLLGA